MIEIENTNNEKFSFTKQWYKVVIIAISLIAILSITFIDIDKKGEDLVDDSLKEALIVFGIAKGLNAAISVAQGTEISPPGLTITIGEVLDPINDLVEQFSWVMLASITSLGIQKILMNFVTADIFSFIVILAIIVLNIWQFIRFKNDTNKRATFFKITILLVFLRVSIPIMSLVNSYTYTNFVQEDYNIQTSKELVDSSSSDITNITNDTLNNDEKKGFFNSITKMFDSDYYKSKVNQYKDATEETSKYILDLIVAFSFKTILFPLIFLFLLYKIGRGVFNYSK